MLRDRSLPFPLQHQHHPLGREVGNPDWGLQLQKDQALAGLQGTSAFDNLA
jgi:hypothetical protein